MSHSWLAVLVRHSYRVPLQVIRLTEVVIGQCVFLNDLCGCFAFLKYCCFLGQSAFFVCYITCVFTLYIFVSILIHSM